MLNNDHAAARGLHYVAFDLLARGRSAERRDLRGHSWRERHRHLLETLPVSGRIRQIEVLPATPDAHEAMIELGFEGTVLKRPTSLYRSGRHGAWRKLKARHVAFGVLQSIRHGRDGQTYAICDVDGRRVTVLCSPTAADHVGGPVTLNYSHVSGRFPANAGIQSRRRSLLTGA